MTIFSKNLGGPGPFGPPGYAYVGYCLPEWIARTKGALCVRASERYLVLEFRFNLNQGCSGVGTAFPHLVF